MSTNKVLSALREWFTRWRRINPARHDADLWDRLMGELRQIIPPGAESTFGDVYNHYISILEDMSA